MEGQEELGVALAVAASHFGLDPATIPDRWSARQVRLFARLAWEDRERSAQVLAVQVGRLFTGKKD